MKESDHNITYVHYNQVSLSTNYKNELHANDLYLIPQQYETTKRDKQTGEHKSNIKGVKKIDR